MDTSDFLSNIQDDKLLSQITMPGSHDAGVYVGSAKTVGASANSWAVCQHGGLMTQLSAGSRFFDIRVLMREGNVVAHHSNKFFGKRFGSTGGALDTMLGEVNAFLDARDKEFVILRVSKSKPEREVVDLILDKCGNRLVKGGGNLASRPIGELRGKIIAVFDNETFKNHVKAGAGIHPFFKYPHVENFGLSFCGRFAENNNIIEVYLDQLEKLQKHDEHVGPHLSVCYWTQTSPKIFSKQRNVKDITDGGAAKKTIEEGMAAMRDRLGSHQNGNAMAFQQNKDLIEAVRKKRLRAGVAPPTLPNIVMYDFVNPASSVPIIALNWPHLRVATR